MLRRYTETERFWQSVSVTLALSWAYIVCLLLVLLLTAVLLRIGASPETRASNLVTITVPPGASREYVADVLRGNKLIRSRTVFNIIVHIGYEGRPFMPGTYQMRQNMLLFEVLEKLVSGELATTRVTIPEGFTIKQIAARLDKRMVTHGKEFTEMALTDAGQFEIDSPTGSLEGYLFPDTYLLYLKQPPEKVIRRMLQALKNQVIVPFEDEISRQKHSLHEVLTIASLVEREARLEKDRARISSVIYNRLRVGMPLQVDATVLYGEGKHKARVLYSDLKYDSAYNTYRHKGLPPGPIANPGLASIEAAVRPARTNYFYYVAKPDGSHLFATTYAEHLANIHKAREQ